MGYRMDRDLLAVVKPYQKYDYTDFCVDEAFKASIIAPKSPENLFDNCRRLIEREFGISKN
jgi:hypothetical protein